MRPITAGSLPQTMISTTTTAQRNKKKRYAFENDSSVERSLQSADSTVFDRKGDDNLHPVDAGGVESLATGTTTFVPQFLFLSASAPTIVQLSIDILTILVSVIVLSTIGLAILRGYQFWQWITSSDGENETSKNTAIESSEVSAGQLIQNGNDAIEKNKQAVRNSDYDGAIEYLSTAISQYQSAVDLITNPDTVSDLQTTIDKAKNEKRKIKSIIEDQNEIKDKLKSGEQSFQEGIVAYVNNDKTVSRIRFRQARDNYMDAIELIEDNDEDYLTPPVKVSVDPGREFSTTMINELSTISEAVATILADAGINSIADLNSTDEPPWTPPSVVEAVDSEGMSKDAGTTLTLLSMWNDADSCEFESLEEISRRQQQAEYGFAKLSS